MSSWRAALAGATDDAKVALALAPLLALLVVPLVADPRWAWAAAAGAPLLAGWVLLPSVVVVAVAPPGVIRVATAAALTAAGAWAGWSLAARGEPVASTAVFSVGLLGAGLALLVAVTIVGAVVLLVDLWCTVGDRPSLTDQLLRTRVVAD